MWPWSDSSDKKPAAPPPTEPPKASPNQTTTGKATPPEAFDPKKLPPREQLSPKLQKILDKEEKEDNFFDELVEG